MTQEADSGSQGQEGKPQDQSPEPGSQEHDAQMADKGRQVSINGQPAEEPVKADQGTKGQPEGDNQEGKRQDKSGEGQENNDKAQRPEWCPEKFWDADKGEVRTEEAFKSLNSLEKKMGSQEKSGEEEGTEGQADEDQAKDERDPAKDLSDNIERAAKKFSETGEIPEKTAKKLQKAGLSEEHLNNYMEGLRAVGTLRQMRAEELAGGSENLKEALNWAKDSLSPEEIKDYDQKVSSGATYEDAVRALVSRFESANGREGNLVTSGAGNSAGPGDVYESKREMIDDMSSEKYHKDPAFRAHVQKKLSRSQKAGKRLA